MTAQHRFFKPIQFGLLAIIMPLLPAVKEVSIVIFHLLSVFLALMNIELIRQIRMSSISFYQCAYVKNHWSMQKNGSLRKQKEKYMFKKPQVFSKRQLGGCLYLE